MCCLEGEGYKLSIMACPLPDNENVSAEDSLFNTLLHKTDDIREEASYAQSWARELPMQQPDTPGVTWFHVG